MKQAVEKIIKGIAGSPDLAEVYEAGDGRNVRFEVRLAPEDYGRVIGREGRTIKAIRSLLFFAGQKHGRRYQIDLIED
ncbi:MAG: KH domain-containing protein [Pyrinomonadaceae bacterium]|jgi:hypothetical protein